MNPYDEFDLEAGLDAAIAAAAEPDVPAPPPWRETRVVGKPLPRIDAYERVSGTAVYASDVILAGMLHAAVLRCPHAHARVTRVDATRARRMPGVRAVLTPDSPGADIPWYGGQKGPLSRLLDRHCRFQGEEVAAVAADTPYQAHDALAAITVEYEVLPFAVSIDAALDKNATPVLDGPGNRAGDPRVVERGDIASGFAAADVVVEETYSTATEIHVPIELHGCVAKWDGPSLTVWDSLQGVFPAQATLARALGLPIARVRVIGPYMGGGFGAKLDTGKYAVIAALLARETGRPVRLFMTREDTITSIGNRPGVKSTVKIGATRDGTLTAIEFRCIGSGGAYSAGGTGGVDWQPLDLYRCPNVRTVSENVFMNAGPERPFRAPGHPQGAWALEQALDTLASRLNMDPVALRLQNFTEVSQARPGQPRYSTTGLRECLTEGARTFGWDDARKAGQRGALTASARGAERGGAVRGGAERHAAERRGVGMAAGMWRGGAGGPPSTIIVRLLADGSANLNMGASDLGTGTKTVMAMVVAEELGVPLERISVEHADTGTTQYTGPSGGSKTVPTEAPAVRAAALAVKRELLALAGAQLQVDPATLSIEQGAIVGAGEGGPRLKVTEVQALRRRGVLVGVGIREPDTHGLAVNPFGAHFAEVSVNTRTGEVRVLRYVAAQESGRVMNLLTYRNQVVGAVTQGAGLALTEERVLDEVHRGRVLTRNLYEYKVPTALDVPPAPECVAIDPHDEVCNTAGAKGLGEPALIPSAAAIANAVADAIGVHIVDSPITPARVLEALARRS
ncbi:MAG: xanthine dehydrogenase family protein molybdopterin-binding subunit [Vicinamibacteraceae bacterium]|nr:xanthine dehydrogenase family protein molybdopterin-binding subunit [Vicinamibacteraceae bacterium]